ncbi:hypothetical protein ACOME3_002014 [Neoechinorhynchus agilis]
MKYKSLVLTNDRLLEILNLLGDANRDLNEIELGLFNVYNSKNNLSLLRKSVYLIEDFQKRIKEFSHIYRYIGKLINSLEEYTPIRFELAKQIEESENKWKNLWIRSIELECLLQKSFLLSIKVNYLAHSISFDR